MKRRDMSSQIGELENWLLCSSIPSWGGSPRQCAPSSGFRRWLLSSLGASRDVDDNLLNCPASSLNFRSRARREFMRADIQRSVEIAIAQDFNQPPGRRCSYQTSLCQCLSRHLAGWLKNLKLPDIHNSILALKEIIEPFNEGQTARQPQLSAFKPGRNIAASACLLALGTASGGLHTTRTMTPPHAAFLSASASGRLQIGKSHWATSSTRTRWLTFCTIPRTLGLSSCSTTCCSRWNPSARIVRFWGIG